MANNKSCSCSGVFFSSLLAFGLVGGALGYLGYKYIKDEMNKQNKNP